jgi:7-carboxy-7-deazaguanine synthase
MTADRIFKINEIYASVQGEGSRSGVPFTFVRTTGCALRCAWCDTAYAFYEGEQRSLGQVLSAVKALAPRHVLLTGGEPLEQDHILTLARELIEGGYIVLVETGGHIDIGNHPQGLIRVLDIKCPASKMEHRNRWANLSYLTNQDELKFVVKDREDFDYAVAVVHKYGLDKKVAALLFSPVHGALDPSQLSDWLLEQDESGQLPFINARLNLQLHKYVWPAARRGV